MDPYRHEDTKPFLESSEKDAIEGGVLIHVLRQYKNPYIIISDDLSPEDYYGIAITSSVRHLLQNKDVQNFKKEVLKLRNSSSE